MKFLLVLVLGCTGGVVRAQHCGYDFMGIMVVQITADSASSQTIKNLKVALLWDQDSAFWENGTPYKGKYWFAEQNYVHTCRYDLKSENYMVKIEDVDGEANGGKFKTQTVPLKKNSVYPLCTNFSDWTLGEKGGFVKGYAPMRVVLFRE